MDRDATPIDRSARVKDAIRAAAGELFSTRGFEATGVRDIAAVAGANPAIVIRHFGSKEALFIETMDAAGSVEHILDVPLEQLGEHVVRALMSGRTRGLSVFGTVVRASDRPDIHAYLRRSIVERFAVPLVSRIEAPDAELRAHLFAAQLIGLITALVIYEDRFLAEAPVDDVVARYGSGLQRLLTGE